MGGPLEVRVAVNCSCLGQSGGSQRFWRVPRQRRPRRRRRTTCGGVSAVANKLGIGRHSSFGRHVGAAKMENWKLNRHHNRSAKPDKAQMRGRDSAAEQQQREMQKQGRERRLACGHERWRCFDRLGTWVPLGICGKP